MGDMIYLIAGYAVFWLVSFGFIYSMVSRQRSLEKNVAVLEQLIQQNSNTGSANQPINPEP
jgi:CcmD family protein